jgi:hypothetical protein
VPTEKSFEIVFGENVPKKPENHLLIFLFSKEKLFLNPFTSESLISRSSLLEWKNILKLMFD